MNNIILIVILVIVLIGFYILLSINNKYKKALSEILEDKPYFELAKNEKEYKAYIKLLEEKSKNAIRITRKSDELIFIGMYADEYPEIHLVEVYEDINKEVYRLDKS